MAGWRLPKVIHCSDGSWRYVGNGMYERELTQQETNTMSVTAGETLDGMTVEQLRNLAKRAEVAAKKQEAAIEEKGYVKLGKIDGYEWRIRRSDGACEACIGGYWGEFYKGLGAVIQKRGVPDLKNIQAIVAAYTETRR